MSDDHAWPSGGRSPMLGVVAKALGAEYDEVLTGFKWIANRALERKKKSGEHFVFGFGEALGYTVDEVVRDKDGISPAVLFGELAAARPRGGWPRCARLASAAANAR